MHTIKKSKLIPISNILLLFDDNKIKKARKPEKKQKENQVECTDEKEIQFVPSQMNILNRS